MDTKAYEKLFKQLIMARHKRNIDFQTIESRLEHLRCGEALKYDDLLIIGDDKCWPFSEYWMWPSRIQIEAQLPRTKGWFKDLPVREEDVIRKLDVIFKNLQLVSIILRFIQPIYYAIYSRPPLKTLQIERGATNAAEYLNYLQVMRTLMRSLQLQKTADVDIFVWAASHEKGDLLKKLKNVLARDLPNNLSPHELIEFLNKDPIRIADAFLRRKEHEIAGYWTAHAFDKFLNDECRSCLGYNTFSLEDDIKYKIEIVSKMPRYKNRFVLLDNIRKLRNRVVHYNIDISISDVEQFYEGVKRLLEAREKSASVAAR